MGIGAGDAAPVNGWGLLYAIGATLWQLQ